VSEDFYPLIKASHWAHIANATFVTLMVVSQLRRDGDGALLLLRGGGDGGWGGRRMLQQTRMQPTHTANVFVDCPMGPATMLCW
jgi:hypothetical protein